MDKTIEASFSTLAISIASSAAMSLGLVPHPESNKTEKDLKLAAFNIDLLLMLQDKTKNNLTNEERDFLAAIIADLQTKYVQNK